MVPAYENRLNATYTPLRLVRQQNPTILFAPAARDGERYRLDSTVQAGASYTDVILILSGLRALLAGKSEEDPRVTLTIHTRWTLTKYDASLNINRTWDILSGSYESEKHSLSEWLADDGELLKARVNEGLDESLTKAFSALATEKEKQKWAGFSTDDSF